MVQRRKVSEETASAAGGERPDTQSDECAATVPETRIIYARYDERGIDVYQAFKPSIVEEALRHGRFGKGFGLDRMTWIKPSFLWLMERSGWGTNK